MPTPVRIRVAAVGAVAALALLGGCAEAQSVIDKAQTIQADFDKTRQDIENLGQASDQVLSALASAQKAGSDAQSALDKVASGDVAGAREDLTTARTELDTSIKELGELTKTLPADAATIIEPVTTELKGLRDKVDTQLKAL